MTCDLGRPGRVRPRHRDWLYPRRQPGLDAPDPNQVLPWFSAQPISEESKRKILWDNAVRLYGFSLPGERTIEIALVVCGRYLLEEKFRIPFFQPRLE